MNTQELEATAKALVVPGKGILAADESLPTIEKRFKSVGVPSTEETRRAYRETLFTTPGLGEFISGVILFDETIRQNASYTAPFVEVLRRQGIILGIKVDKGAKPLAGFPGEKITEGLDGLRDRLAEYKRLGARFTKWRAVITIGANIPSLACLEANAHALARFAALSQEAGLVPVVEPEVLMEGDHTIKRHFEVTEAVLKAVFQSLFEQRVRLEAMLLKPNMVLAGKDCPRQATVAEVAEATLRCLKRAVPAAVPGVVFLSGGQSDVQATEHLNALNDLERTPWELSFSFGRALQAPAVNAWQGDPENVPAAQHALVDGSPESEQAVRETASRTWPSGTEIRVLTVIDPKLEVGAALSGSLARPWLQEHFQGAKEGISAMTIKLAESLRTKGRAAEPHIFEGDPKKVLLREAESWDADCIFLGARGLDHGGRWLLGSVASAVASRAHCSVEIVRPS
jgi:fructose-bisphosphate aldolase class I